MRTAILMLAMAATAVAQQVTKEDIIKLHEAGCGDDLILTYIGARGAQLNLSTDDITSLKGGGVSDRVIGEILKGVRPPPREPAPPIVVQRPAPVVVYEPPPVVIYRDPWPYVYHDPLWYDPYYHHPHYSFGFGHHGHHSGFFFGTHW